VGLFLFKSGIAAPDLHLSLIAPLRHYHH